MSASSGTPLSIRLRLWIIVPHFLLVLGVLVLFAALLQRSLAEGEEERLLRQLADSAQQALDAVARAEIELLGTERLLANTEGVPEALLAQDAEGLRSRVLPLAVSTRIDFAVVTDSSGTGLLAVRREPEAGTGVYTAVRGETFYREWPAVAGVLSGELPEASIDKVTGLETILLGERLVHVFFVAAPLRSADDQIIGVVLVGAYLDGLADTLRSQAGAGISLYSVATGAPLASTLTLPDPADLSIPTGTLAQLRSGPPDQSLVRSVELGGVGYRELLTLFATREGRDVHGLIGVSLLEATLGTATGLDPLLLLFGAGVLISLALAVSFVVSELVVRAALAGRARAAGASGVSWPAPPPERTPRQLVSAAARGEEFTEPLPSPMPRGSGSPSAAEGLPAVATLAGNKVPVAVMNASLDGLTTLIGNLQAQQAAALIEDYHREVEAIVARHRGMVAAFDGEAWTCVFGLLPRPQPPHVAALLAVHAGLSVVDWVVEAKIRFARSGGSAALGENVVDMVAGIGIASGTGVIGVVGAKDRLTATVLADTVGKAQRLRSLTRELGGGLLIDGTTYGHLAKDQDQFEYGRYGRAPLSADGEEETMFEVVGRKNRLVEDDAERIT